MLHRTRGIVIRVTDYSETSVVAKVYTEKFGIQSYLLNGVKRKKSRIRLNALQPLTLLSMVVYHKDNKGLHHVSDLRQEPLFSTIPYDMKKVSVVFLMNEIIGKAIRESESNKNLFTFLHDAILFLDNTAETIEVFYISFMVHFAKELGFAPGGKFSEHKKYFNLKEGIFQNSIPEHPHWLQPDASANFFLLMQTPLEQTYNLNFSAADRKQLRTALLNYYRLHVEGFTTSRSQKIMEEVWE
jgi:DNA repair protein RecO (recombination protein O)